MIDTNQVAWWYAKTGRLFGPNMFRSHLEAVVSRDILDHVGDEKLSKLALRYDEKFSNLDEDEGGEYDAVELLGWELLDRAYDVGLVRILWPTSNWLGDEFNVKGNRESLRSMFRSSVSREIVKEAESSERGMSFVVEIHGEEDHVFAKLPMERQKFNAWLSKL